MEHVRLFKRSSGNLTEYTVKPGGAWHGTKVRWDGNINESEYSKAPLELAVANTGNWSGGGCWRGWIFGRPGTVVLLTRRSVEKWIVFTNEGVEEHDMNPFFEEPVEI